MDYKQILQEYSVAVFDEAENRLKLKCPDPEHSDAKPSAYLYLERGNIHCFGCKRTWTLYQALSLSTGVPSATVYHDIQKRFGHADDIIFPSEQIEQYHAALWQEDKLLLELRKRDISDKAIREHKLGRYNSKTIVIPLPNEAGYYISLRLYNPFDAENKFSWLNPKRAKNQHKRVYPFNQLSYHKILLTGGELKAIKAAEKLNEHDIGALTSHYGEKHIDETTLAELRDHIVYVCMDVDETGIKDEEHVCSVLHERNNSEVYKCELGKYLDVKQFPKGDLNDFKGDFLQLIKNAIKYEKPERISIYESNGEVEKTSLTNAVHAVNANKRVEFKAVISAKEESPFPIPKRVHINCSRDTKHCVLCDVKRYCTEESSKMEVHEESQAIVRMVGCSEKEQHRIFMEEFGIPHLCRVVYFRPETFHNVESICVSSEMDITSLDEERNMQPAYCVNAEQRVLEINATYRFTGRMFPHPRSQQATLLLSEQEITEDALTSYKPRDLSPLEIFQPNEWTVKSIKDKLNDIYSDLEANITHIFRRRSMHIAVDLAYHSPLHFMFDTKLQRGWVNLLLFGDSSQGKSETIDTLRTHYRLGPKIDSGSVTPAGLIGGVQKFGERYFITWGEFPNNDRRIIIIEELKDLHPEVFAKLKETRSSGQATITKIEKRRALARTRMIATSNPAATRTLSSYNFGVAALKDVIPGLEDIRRFDLILLLDRNELDITELQKFRPDIKHKYTSDLCHELILYCWKAERVFFETRELEKRVFDFSEQLQRKFCDSIPIVDRGSMHIKLAKLAAALAGRTFSIQDSGSILIRECHLEYIFEFLEKEYSKPEMGYLAYSTKSKAAENLKDRDAVIGYIHLTLAENALEFVDHVLNQDIINPEYVMHLMNWDSDTTKTTLSFFLRQRALKPEGRGYRKTVDFTNLLRNFPRNGDVNLPNYIKEGKY